MGIATNDDHDTQTTGGDLSGDTIFGTTRDPSMRVVAAVADASGRDPIDLPPLYDTIDTDALDRVLEAEATVEAVFEYYGHTVEITGGGFVAVDGDRYVIG